MKEQEKERVQQLTEAIDAAELFVRRAKAARQAFKTGTGDTYRCVEFASVKRVSMELTRALVPIRRSLYQAR